MVLTQSFSIIWFYLVFVPNEPMTSFEFFNLARVTPLLHSKHQYYLVLWLEALSNEAIASSKFFNLAESYTFAIQNISIIRIYG